MPECLRSKPRTRWWSARSSSAPTSIADKKADAQSLLEELEELVDTLGIPVVERKLVHHREQHPRYLIGSGKAQEIVDLAKKLECDVLVFDNELSPSQQRNWEELAGMTVADRQEIILDIFGARAQTREARIQVDLARMEYSLPRLTRAWSHLGQQGGGIGAKGEGESQLEQDKRKIRLQIDRLKRELETVRSARATQRKDRKRAPVPNAAIVGYTNVGKSSLLRRLTGADVFIENKLFATLDTTTRKIALPNKQPLLLTDTVGFVRKLPASAGRSVQRHARGSRALRFPHPRARCLAAGSDGILQHDHERPDRSRRRHQADARRLQQGRQSRAILPRSSRCAGIFPRPFLSPLKTGEGMDELVERISEFVARGTMTVELRLPSARADLLARLHREGTVRDIQYEEGFTRVAATIPTRSLEIFAPFLDASEAADVAFVGDPKSQDPNPR